MDWSKTDVTKGRMNRTLKYFRNKLIKVEFEYNNSLGHHWVRSYIGMYKTFKIESISDGYGYDEIQFWLYNKFGKCVFEEGVVGGEYYGNGKIRYCNSGPYCYLTFKRLNPLFNLKGLIRSFSEGIYAKTRITKY